MALDHELLVVPKRRVEARVTLASGAEVDGVLFLSVADRVRDVFDARDSFFAFERGGAISFVACAAVAAISVAPLAAPIGEAPSELARVRVRASCGRAFEGALERGPGARTLDALNSAGDVLELRDAARVHFVSRRHVEAVEETS